MSDDLSQDIIPVKDAPDVYRKNISHDTKDERRFVFKLPREELEDRFLRVCEDNMVLKTHSRKQEDKIKKMATKLIRLINDHKKQEQGGGQQVRRRDLETEELIEEMQDKIRDLDRQNTHLKEKLVTAKQQLAQHSKRISPVSHRHNQPKNTTKNITKITSDDESRDHDYFREMRLELSNFKSQLTSADAEIEYLTGLLSERETEYEKQILQLKAQVKNTQKQNVDENVELIKLQREMKITQEKMTSLLEQYTKLKENTRLLKISHDQVVNELDNVSSQLKDEQSKSLKLRSELQMAASNQHIINELKAENLGLEKENEILKESNLKLINSSFNFDHEKRTRKNETTLKMKIAEMQEIIETDLKDKEKMSIELTTKQMENEKLKETLQEAETIALRFKEMYEDIKEKSEFLTRNDLDMRNLTDAVTALREEQIQHEPINENISNEQTKELKLIRADHAETVNELAKLRAMLQLQYQINTDYKREIETINQKLYQTEQELKQRSDEYKKALNSQISKNEIIQKQLSDVARGVAQISHFPESRITEVAQTHEKSPQIEICFKQLRLTRDGNSKLDNDKASMLTWSFYDFELTATKIVYGFDPNFNCTVVYPITIDETFVEYLQVESIRVELHRVVGTEYTTIAQGFIRLNKIIEINDERIHGNLSLISIEDSVTILGTVEFWILINIPVSIALSHYRDRSKASGYLNANLQSDRGQTIKTDHLPQHMNEISIKIIQCKELKSDHRDVEPTSYIVYKFFDWPDHDTILIPFSKSPYFNDRKVYRVIVDQVLYSYLLHSSLLIYAFDDSDPRPDVFLGVASVPLFSLIENKTIHGSFEFKRVDGSPNGTVDLTIQWLKPFVKPNDNLLTLINKSNSAPTPIPRKSKSETSTPVKEIEKEIVEKPPVAPRKSQENINVNEELKESERKSEPQQKEENVEIHKIESDENETDESSEIEEKTDSIDETSSSENEFDEESDSDVVTLNKSVESVTDDKITIEILNLILFDGTWIMKDDEIQMLYVEFRFLDFLPEETETPVALPKPKPNQPIIYNYHKEFKMGDSNSGIRKQMLKKILTSDDPKDKALTFTVVNEPREDTSECKDVAFAIINVKKIFDEDRDLIEEVVPLFAADEAKTEVGRLKISVRILQVLKVIAEEIDDFDS